MKKHLITILAAAISLSLAACGNTDSASADQTPAADTEVAAPASSAQTEDLTEAEEEPEEAEAPETEDDSDTESGTSSADAEPEESVSDLLKECYGSWRLVSLSGATWEEFKNEHTEEECSQLLENMKEDYRFELGDPSYLVRQNISEREVDQHFEITHYDYWTEFDLTEKDGEISGHVEGELSFEDDSLIWNFMGMDLIFEKISDTPEPNPHWYYGEYMLTRVRDNAEGSEWRDPEEKWSYVSIGMAGPDMGAGGILPGNFRISLDMESKTMTAKSQETEETVECAVEFTKDQLTVTTEDLILEYAKD